jgi:phosphatidylinositol alpha-mannosyltransferase
MVVPYDLAEEGGVKRHAMQLASTLRRLGDEVDVIGPLTRGKQGGDVIGFAGVYNIPANGSDNRLGIFACPWKVAKLFRERRYDVLHVHEPLQPSINYYALWSAGGAARIGTFHGFMEQESQGLLRARKFWSAIAYPWYDRGIAVSPAAADFAGVTFKKPLTIIPNGIRTELYSPGRTPRSVDAGAPLRMLFVGHWRDSRKGLPYLLEACGKLRERGVAWTLDIVGDGGQTPRSDLPGITYHGPISSEQRLAELYAASDVFVSPAMGGESFGIVLLEAMASARAIVCSDIAGYRYAVGAGPECGARLVPPGSVEGLVAALAELASDPGLRARFGAANRERARRFDWDRLVASVRDEYLAALEARGVAVEAHRAPEASAGAAV